VVQPKCWVWYALSSPFVVPQTRIAMRSMYSLLVQQN